MANAYPSSGRLLSQATYSGTAYPVLTYPAMREVQPIIANDEFSDYEPIDDAQQFRLRIKYEDPPTAATTIQIASDPTFADAVTLDTIPLSATDTVAFWSSAQNVAYNGCIRVSNTSDVQINEVKVQKQVASVG